MKTELGMYCTFFAPLSEEEVKENEHFAFDIIAKEENCKETKWMFDKLCESIYNGE